MGAAQRALRTCATSGCPTLVPKGHCAKHATKPWAPNHTVKRIEGGKLQRLRRQLFNRQPLCVHCLQRGRYRLPEIRDHIIPLSEGGQDVEANTQALCLECSDAKTAQEAARGRRRQAGGYL